MSYGPPGNNPFTDPKAPGANPYAPPGAPPGFPGQLGAPLPPGTVKNYLVEAILCLVCCGGVFAIPAIVYASQVNSKLQAGDYQGAVDASQNAQKWCLIAVCIGVVCGGLAGGIQVLGIIAGGR